MLLVDKALIGRKLERVESYLTQIGLKKDPGLASFMQDRDLQSIVLFNLIQAIQSCIDMGSHIISDSEWEMPSTQAEIFEILASRKIITNALAKKMIRMIGFRNRIVHEYEKTDMKIVHTVWKKHRVDIENFCRAVVKKYHLQ
jgi:uncharacterized protein YutE (UPF0331/DUF86 family)